MKPQSSIPSDEHGVAIEAMERLFLRPLCFILMLERSLALASRALHLLRVRRRAHFFLIGFLLTGLKAKCPPLPVYACSRVWSFFSRRKAKVPTLTSKTIKNPRFSVYSALLGP